MSKKFSFTFELSNESISNLIRNLKEYSRELENSKKYILEALSKYTAERVKYYINLTVGKGGYPITNELYNSILISPIFEDMVRVYTNLSYAQFVEFGTGVTGSKHPKSNEANWVYDKNEYGENGWVYRSSDGNFYWTKGEEAHQFMYRAGIDLRENYLRIAEEVLKERGLIK